MTPGWAFRRGMRWLALAFLAGCGTRERFVFPSENPGDGSGPTTEITHPAAADTAITEGDLLVIQGRAFDSDGVDTVYLAVGGINQGFAPILGQGKDTVDFAAQLSTIGHSGATVIVQAYGVDLLGQQGSVVSRQIHIE
ncbi:MAG TPA: hypothetical protein VJQ46_00045 [Gemmatimonadales bacterium]|nr:hypothetical protein [Gemmatimonadales bacterium]